VILVFSMEHIFKFCDDEKDEKCIGYRKTGFKYHFRE
jgi:hypothetical protein